MKIIGALFMIASSTLISLYLSKNLKIKVNICDELINLCNIISSNINFSQTDIEVLLQDIVKNSKYLDFISVDMIKTKGVLDGSLTKDENIKIADFVYQLGKYDVENQLKQIAEFKTFIENTKEKYVEIYKSKSKIIIVCGFSFGTIASLLII